MTRKSYITTFLSIVILLGLSGCTFPWQKKAPLVNTVVYDSPASSTPSSDIRPLPGDIRKFKNLDELQAFLIKNPLVSTNRSNRDLVAPNISLAESESKSLAGEASNNYYSSTNLQVAGVDEADIMKNNGEYIYLLDYNDLNIIKAKPAKDAAVITKISFKSRPQEFYISGDRLVVFGYDDQIINNKTYQSFKRQSQFTYLKVFDISDPKNPKQIRDLNIEGSYSNSRVVGDYLYFVTNNYHQGYLSNEPILPRVISGGTVLAENCSLTDKCYAPNIYYFNIPYQSYNFTSVNAINLKNASEQISGDVYLLSADQNMYVSANNIYITYTEYLDEEALTMEVGINAFKNRLPVDDQAKITKIEAVDNFILSDREKKTKIATLMENYFDGLDKMEKEKLNAEMEALLKKTMEEKSKEMEKTVIHKISFDGSKLEYKAGGQVSGQVLNQFSMDENNNYFRIATTRSQSWSRFSATSTASYNNVYVLDENLKTLGSLENLAPGERIYATRFMGDRVYLVSYRQTDPLFAIDLKDPKNPKVLGELKIPGYSTYLHPYSENLLLGFGRDTGLNSSGVLVNKGLKLGLFDISKPGAPVELDTFITGDDQSNSLALSDHKAFLASSAKNLVSIPVTLWSYQSDTQSGDRLGFSGALVFEIANNKIKLRGQIDHSDGGNYTKTDYFNGFNYYDNSVKRSLYISDALYTFSNKYLKINDLKSSVNDLASLKIIDLLPNLSKDFEIKPISVPEPEPDTSTSSPETFIPMISSSTPLN